MVMPKELQRLARIILESPDHIGVSTFLKALHDLRKSHSAFKNIHLDYSHEFWDAVRLASHEDLEQGLGQVLAARVGRPHALPKRAISTVHKSKGLETKNVLLLPCNANTFGENQRCLLYVALSRASHQLTIVVSRNKQSPLIEI